MKGIRYEFKYRYKMQMHPDSFPFEQIEVNCVNSHITSTNKLNISVKVLYEKSKLYNNIPKRNKWMEKDNNNKKNIGRRNVFCTKVNKATKSEFTYRS